jgi:hypothetical protein
MADVAGFMISAAMYLFLPVLVEFVQIPRSSGYGLGASVVIAAVMLVPMSAGSRDCNFNGVTPETEGDTSDRRDERTGPG